jgi:hypothetical protein
MIELATITAPDTKDIDTASASLVRLATAFEVADAPSYKIAGEHTLSCRSRIKAVKALFQEAKADANRAHKSICALENTCLGPFKVAQDLFDGKMGRYKSEEEARVRREQEAEDRERRRLAEEQARKAEELRKADLPEAAEAMIADTPPAPAPVVRTEVPVVKGISARKGWGYKIVDATMIDRAFLTVNEGAIRGLVDRIGPLAEGQVGGIEVFPKTTMAGRTG